MQASRYALTMSSFATELLRRAADARTSDNLAHVADTDTGRTGEGTNDGSIDDAGGSVGQICGGVRIERTGSVRSEEGRKVG